MCAFPPQKRMTCPAKERIECDAYGGLMKSNTSSSRSNSSSNSSSSSSGGGRRKRRMRRRAKRSRGAREEEPGSTTRARRNEIFERRRTDVGRCFYERPAVCVDVNYIGGHEEQIAASSDAGIRM